MSLKPKKEFKIPKMFLGDFALLCFVFFWTELPSETIKFGWLSWCFLRFFFPTSNWPPNLLAICGLFCWFLLGQEGIWQGDFSFVQLADPQSLGQSFTALLLENREFKPSITITKTFLNESCLYPYPWYPCFSFSRLDSSYPQVGYASWGQVLGRGATFGVVQCLNCDANATGP